MLDLRHIYKICNFLLLHRWSKLLITLLRPCISFGPWARYCVQWVDTFESKLAFRLFSRIWTQDTTQRCVLPVMAVINPPERQLAKRISVYCVIQYWRCNWRFLIKFVPFSSIAMGSILWSLHVRRIHWKIRPHCSSRRCISDFRQFGYRNQIRFDFQPWEKVQKGRPPLQVRISEMMSWEE